MKSVIKMGKRIMDIYWQIKMMQCITWVPSSAFGLLRLPATVSRIYTDDVHVAEPTSARALPSAFAATHKKGTNEFSVE